MEGGVVEREAPCADGSCVCMMLMIGDIGWQFLSYVRGRVCQKKKSEIDSLVA